MRTVWNRSAGVAALVMTMAAAGCGMTVVPNEVFTSTPGVVLEGEGFALREGEPIALPYALAPAREREDLVNQYDDFRDDGARQVRVRVPGLETPLYGVLSLHQLPPDARGPARRSLSVQIPKQYVDAASDGRVSVVYEPVASGDAQYYGWILWLSDRPF